MPLPQLLYLNQFTLYVFLWLKEYSFVDIKLEENSLMTLVAILKETEYYDVNNNKEPRLRTILAMKIRWSVVMALRFLLHAEVFAIMFFFLNDIRQSQDVKKITSMTNNITCKNYFRRYFRYSKLVGCTTSVFPSLLFIHVSYGEASILLEIWEQSKSCSWSWPHHVTICLTTELHGGSYGRKNLRWRLSCKYRWCCISERNNEDFFFRFQCIKIW